jgi:hypothetical protein
MLVRSLDALQQIAAIRGVDEPLSMYNSGAGAPYFSASELRERLARASERLGELIQKK